MANLYYAIFGKQVAVRIPPQQKWEKATVGLEKAAAPGVTSGHLESAKVVALEAESVAEAQQAVQHFFGGDVNNTPTIVTEAQMKES